MMEIKASIPLAISVGGRFLERKTNVTKHESFSFSNTFVKSIAKSTSSQWVN